MRSDPIYYSIQDIQRYLNGGMNKEEMHELEKAALSDPMLSDAIDGMRKTNIQKANADLNELRAKLFASKQSTIVPLVKRNYSWLRWAVAAAVIGIITIGAWWIMQPPKTEEISRLNPSIDSGMLIKPHTSIMDESKNDTQFLERDIAKEVPKKTVNSTKNSEQLSPILATPANEFAQQNEQPTIAKVAAEPVLANPIAADREIRGVVKDEKGKPIPFASIAIGNNKAIVADKEGNFKIKTADSIVQAEISSLGHDAQTVLIAANQANEIAMRPTQKQLEEVVVVGYGTRSKRQITEAATKVTPKENNPLAAVPIGGWDKFYKNIHKKLGTDASLATKTLHLDVYTQNAKPMQVVVTQAQDSMTTKLARDYILKNTKWSNPDEHKPIRIILQVN